MKKIAFVALLSACIATPALADNTGKFYSAVDLGAASYSNATITVGGVQNTFGNPGMFRIAGGYHITPMIAAEVAYARLGDSVLANTAGNITLSTSALQVAAVATYPVDSQFEVLGKIGVSANSVKLTTTGAYAGQDWSGSKTDLLLGVGALYNINSQYTVRAQFDSFGATSGITNATKVSAFSIGVAYNF